MEVNRALTAAFIAASPVTLVLTPRERVRKASGGYELRELRPRAPQQMTLVEPTSEPRPVVTENGQDRVVEYMLVGLWDAGLRRYDVFTHDGKTWEVVEMFPDNGYERRALVARRG